MPIHVKVVTAAEYTTWVAEQRKLASAKADDPAKVWTLPDLLARGEKIYTANCAACHQASGKGAGAIKPLDGSAVVTGAPSDMMHVVLEGRAGGAMPSWKQLSDTDLAAVVTFAKNHWSNKTGQLIQPAEFQSARSGKFPAGGGAAPVAAPAAESSTTPAAPTGGTQGAQSPEGPFHVFFESGKSVLGSEAVAEAKRAAAYWLAHKDGKIVLSGFVDSTGSADQNAELAKQRAQAVRNVLTDNGVAADRIELRKPEVITAGAGDDRQARRVDIVAAQ